MSIRIVLASLLGFVLVGSALFTVIRHNGPSALTDTSASSQEATATTLTLTTEDWQAALAHKAALQSASTSSTTLSSLTETDQLVRSLLGPYFSETAQGAYSREQGVRIADRATAEALALVYAPLTPDDITTTNATSTTAVRTYKAAMQQALTPLFSLDEYELTIYARATEHNDPADFRMLAQYAAAYRTAGDAVRAIAAPRDVSAVHLAVVNNLYHLATVLDALAAGFNDPARSLSGVYNFTPVEEEFSQAFAKLNTYFILKGVN